MLMAVLSGGGLIGDIHGATATATMPEYGAWDVELNGVSSLPLFDG